MNTLMHSSLDTDNLALLVQLCLDVIGDALLAYTNGMGASGCRGFRVLIRTGISLSA